MGLLVEGPLANLRKSEMHLSKPTSKLVNKFNPGASFMSRSMVSAKELMVQPPQYNYNHRYDTVGNFQEDYYHSHDPIGYIGHDRRSQTAAANMHIPLSVFVQPPAHPSFFGNVGSSSGGGVTGGNIGGSERSSLMYQMNSQASQEGTASQPLTQNLLSMSQPSQPLSQSELSQDMFSLDDLRSQPDNTLSQDSYQPESSQQQRPILEYTNPAYQMY